MGDITMEMHMFHLGVVAGAALCAIFTVLFTEYRAKRREGKE